MDICFFVSISKIDNRYKQGNEICKDTFETYPGVSFFFYDSESINIEFGKYGLKDFVVNNEPKNSSDDTRTQKFWYIRCQKEAL